MINYKVHPIPNRGFLLADIPTDVLSFVKNEIDNISNNRTTAKKMTSELVGQIANEFEMFDSRSIIEQLSLELVNEYERHFKHAGIRCDVLQNLKLNPSSFELGPLWVNFQKKHEYNPPHKHSGVYSFVMWIKIPYNIKDERIAENSVNSFRNSNGIFYFQFIDSLGDINKFSIDADSLYEGKMLFFPAEMWHGVNPFFSSDDERISISGNIFLKV